MKILVAIVTLVFTASACAADYQPLKGAYKIGGTTIYDPPVAEPQDTHLYLDLEGNSARDLYRAMKAKPEAGLCAERHDLTKRAGGIQCTMVKGGKEYHCAFGVELRTQRIVPGVVC
jgi:hypothetical protein